MINTREITITPESGFVFWKKDDKETEPIPSGKYLAFNCSSQDATELKKYIDIVCASSPYHRFVRLTPDEPWTRKFFGLPIQEKKLEKNPDMLPFYKLSEIIPKLLPWQKDILREMAITLKSGKPFRTGLTVGLGGGKTLLALSICQLGLALYIAPKHLHTTIRDEAEKWNLRCPEISTPEGTKKLQENNYEIIIVDECLSVKNPDAQRSVSVDALAEKAFIVIAMTGTPLSAKRGKDIRWIRVCEKLVPKEEFRMDYAFGINPRKAPIAGKTKIDREGNEVPLEVLVVDSYDTEKIARVISKHYIVKSIDDILAQLPPKQEQRIYFERPKFFRSIKDGLMTNSTKHKAIAQALACTSGFIYMDDDSVKWIEKKPQKIEWIKNFIEENPEEPIVIISHWQAEKDRLLKELAEYSPATEDDTKRFTDEETNILVLSASAAEGLNLQRSRIQIFCSNSTNPVKRTQAEGRLWRQGQNKSVVIYDLLCKDTLDEVHLDLLKKHAEVSEELVEKLLEEELKKIK